MHCHASAATQVHKTSTKVCTVSAMRAQPGVQPKIVPEVSFSIALTLSVGDSVGP